MTSSRLPFQSHHLAWLLSALENLERLRQPGLSAKRSLALREFALGMEGLDGLFSASLCDVCMNVSSACWRWGGNLSIHASDVNTHGSI